MEEGGVLGGLGGVGGGVIVTSKLLLTTVTMIFKAACSVGPRVNVCILTTRLTTITVVVMEDNGDWYF